MEKFVKSFRSEENLREDDLVIYLKLGKLQPKLRKEMSIFEECLKSKIRKSSLSIFTKIATKHAGINNRKLFRDFPKIG